MPRGRDALRAAMLAGSIVKKPPRIGEWLPSEPVVIGALRRALVWGKIVCECECECECV